MINCIILCSTIFLISMYAIYTCKSICRMFKYTKKEVLDIFEYFEKQAYDSIYQSDLISHVVNGVSPRKEETETYERNFIKKCILMMGKKNMKIVSDFFGDNETMFMNMLTYMRKRINEDGLSKIIQNQLNEQAND